MASSGTLRLATLVRADVSEEPSAPIIRVTRINELGRTLAAADSCHPDDGDATYLRNVSSHKSHMT
jgi:hypothetical protein